MIDRPLIRKNPDVAKPEADRWMLDRWTPQAAHQVIAVCHERQDSTGRVVDTLYRAECACGWRSREYHEKVVEPCPVLGALNERANRLKRDGDRTEWKPL